MQARLNHMTAAALIAFSSYAFAQSQQEHQEHHPGGAPTQAQPAQPSQPARNQPSAQASPPTDGQPPSQASPPNAGQPSAGMPMGQMMERMPERCRMMQSMPQNCMSMMQEMMRGDARHGGMMQGGMMGRGMMGGGMQAPASASAASKAYMEAADKMYGPIMEGLQADDPDIAFVRAMIAQRQGAIELAKVRLQYGKDEQTRKWADDTIQRQQAEIDEMQAWLKKQVK
jgi:uncharacterized protein (DUF305 family)